MSALLDLLLSTDPKTLTECPTAKIKVKRLSELCGKDFIVEIRALTQREIDDLPEGSNRVHIILKGVTNLDFGDTKLNDSLKPEGRNAPLTPVEVVQKLFLPGEINKISSEILNISGFGEDIIEKIRKN